MARFLPIDRASGHKLWCNLVHRQSGSRRSAVQTTDCPNYPWRLHLSMTWAWDCHLCEPVYFVRVHTSTEVPQIDDWLVQRFQVTSKILLCG